MSFRICVDQPATPEKLCEIYEQKASTATIRIVCESTQQQLKRGNEKKRQRKGRNKTQKRRAKHPFEANLLSKVSAGGECPAGISCDSSLIFDKIICKATGLAL